MSAGESDPGDRWYLESQAAGQRGARVRLAEWPFSVGRSSQVALTLSSNMISKEHAEIYRSGAELRLRDLGSKNGTFVNRQRIEDAPLVEGDVLHFAHLEFRLGRVKAEVDHRGDTWAHSKSSPGLQAVYDGGKLQRLLKTRAATACFQPIVGLGDNEVVAHEALGRGCSSELSESPAALLSMAATIGLAVELSRLFSSVAIDALRDRPDVQHVFLNLHPSELHEEGLLDSIAVLRERVPRVQLTIELPETAIVEPGSMTGLRAGLKDLGVGLAYDDFGAGQARLLELAEVQPDYLKFDMRLVRGIDKAKRSRHKLVASLVSVAHDLGVRTLAEGIETEGEALTCRELGFEFAQGFHFGHPR